MTAITKDAVQPHDLQSSEVIGRLKQGELLLMDQIASRPYAKIVRLIDSELPPTENWDKIDENLKWVLHTQIAGLAGTYVIEDLLKTLIDAEEEQINGRLEDLIYRYFFVSQDLMAVFYDWGHSTWNLVSYLDPDYFFGLPGLPPPILTKFGEASDPEMPSPPASLNSFCERLIQKGLDRPSVQVVKRSLAEWLEWSQRYRLIIAALYESEDPVETIYAFHYAVSILTRLLAVSLSMKLVLKPLKNQLSQLSD
jgi:hypothetical protein